MVDVSFGDVADVALSFRARGIRLTSTVLTPARLAPPSSQPFSFNRVRTSLPVRYKVPGFLPTAVLQIGRGRRRDLGGKTRPIEIRGEYD